MKKLILFIAGVVCALTGLHAQEKPGQLQPSSERSPISWQYHAQKISENTYNLYITAFIRSGWHLYSQTQPEDAIAIPTAIRFHTGPSLVLEGKTKEVGNLEKDTIASLGISSFQYEGKVEFVQRIKLTEPFPLSIIGSITYQVCKDNECLQPETKDFGIRIN
jgi:thiol:disulfide interchange protein DsbD